MTPITLRAVRPDEATFSLRAEEEQCAVRGNVLDSDDTEAVERAEKAVMEQIERGNIWGWCTVILTAEWNDLTGTDSCDECSYNDEADFKKSSGYYDGMKISALSNLNHHIRSNMEKVQKLAVPLRPLCYIAAELAGRLVNTPVHIQELLCDLAALHHIDDTMKGGKNGRDVVEFFITRVLNRAGEDSRRFMTELKAHFDLPRPE